MSGSDVTAAFSQTGKHFSVKSVCVHAHLLLLAVEISHLTTAQNWLVLKDTGAGESEGVV